MSILDRTILRRLLAGVVLATTTLAALVLLLQLSRIGHHVRAAELLPLLLSAVPSLLAFALPFGVAAALIETYGYLQATWQLEAMRTAGASRMRLARPALGCLLLCLAASMALWRAEPAALRRLASRLEAGAVDVLLQPGRFVQLGDGRTFYARGRGARAGELRGVLLAKRGGEVLLAERAKVEARRIGKRAGVRVELFGAELQQPLGKAASGRLRRVRFERLVFELDIARAVAPHVGFVASVLADPRRLASPPLWLCALTLLATAIALRCRSRLRAALWLCVLGGGYVVVDLGASAATSALWPRLVWVGVVGAGVVLSLRGKG
ncbi:MAG: LptF/LptG family permease [Myxococcales bacterium]|nr:LptF/LptG family permease [Myxococcales bacterium]